MFVDLLNMHTTIMLRILLLLNAVSIVKMLPEGSVKIVHVGAEERSGRSSNGSLNVPHFYSYTIAVVDLDLGFKYHHETPGDTGGSTRLICGTRVFESHDLLNSSDVLFPRHMVTYENSHMYLPTSMAKSLSELPDNTLRSFLVLDTVRTSRMKVLGSPTRDEIFPNQEFEELQCSLILLHPSQQTLNSPRIVRRTRDNKMVWGKSNLRLERGDFIKVEEKKSRHSHELVSELFRDIARKRTQRGACVAHPNVNPEFIQMMTGSGSKLKIIGLLMDLLPTEAFDLLAQMVAAPITQKLEKGDAETASIVMSQQIKNGLMSGLTSRLGRSLIDPLSQTIVETVTETIVLGIQARVSSTVTASVAEALTRDLSRDVAETLPVKLNRMVPGHLTRSLLRDATHVLTNSISHSMVPAIVHTVSHSPLQDYYCYYCYHFSRYCQYCHYAPSQLYYAQYYTEYYCRYYSQYYADYASNVEDLNFKV